MHETMGQFHQFKLIIHNQPETQGQFHHYKLIILNKHHKRETRNSLTSLN